MHSTTVVIAVAAATAVLMGRCEARIDIIPPRSNQSEISVDELQSITYAGPPDDGALGRLVIAKPVNACVPIEPVPYNSNDTFAWFVLVRRYDCTFATKLYNAQRAGFAGVIIYDYDEPDMNLFGGQSPMPVVPLVAPPAPPPPSRPIAPSRPYSLGDLRVYAVLVTRSDGALLRDCTWEDGFLIDWYPSSPFSLLGYLIPVIIIILFMILMIACLVVVQQCHRWYRDRQLNARYRLAKKYLRQLEIRKWTKTDEFADFESCSICLDDYQEGDKLRLLPCRHGYHQRCIDPWLTKNRRVCPLCKRKIVLPGMPEDSSDDESTPLLSGQQTTQQASGGGGTDGGGPTEPFNEREQRMLAQIHHALISHRRRVLLDLEGGEGGGILTVQADINQPSGSGSSRRAAGQQESSSAPATQADAAGASGLYSINGGDDDVEVLPRPAKANKRKKVKVKRSRRQQSEPLDDVTVVGAAGPSSSSREERRHQRRAVAATNSSQTAHDKGDEEHDEEETEARRRRELARENQMVCVTEMGSDDDQPLIT